LADLDAKIALEAIDEDRHAQLRSARRITIVLRLQTETNLRGMEPDCSDIVPGVNTPVLAKHSKSFSWVDSISVGVDRMQRNFEPMRRQVELWWQSELTDVTAKMIIPGELLRRPVRVLAVGCGGNGSARTRAYRTCTRR
jgi:hypothetical protein